MPFGEQPTVLYTPADPPLRHFLGGVAFGHGLLITPTCDMTEQREGGIAHPYRTLVPVLPLELVTHGDGHAR